MLILTQEQIILVSDRLLCPMDQSQKCTKSTATQSSTTQISLIFLFKAMMGILLIDECLLMNLTTGYVQDHQQKNLKLPDSNKSLGPNGFNYRFL